MAGHWPATDQKAIFVSADDTFLTVVDIPARINSAKGSCTFF